MLISTSSGKTRDWCPRCLTITPPDQTTRCGTSSPWPRSMSTSCPSSGSPTSRLWTSCPLRLTRSSQGSRVSIGTFQMECFLFSTFWHDISIILLLWRDRCVDWFQPRGDVCSGKQDHFYLSDGLQCLSCRHSGKYSIPILNLWYWIETLN